MAHDELYYRKDCRDIAISLRKLESRSSEQVSPATYGSNQSRVSRAGLHFIPQARDVWADNVLGLSLVHIIAQWGAGQISAGMHDAG